MLRRTRNGSRLLTLPTINLFPRSFHATSLLSQKRSDHYSVLGISKGADKDEVKKAYYKLVKK